MVALVAAPSSAGAATVSSSGGALYYTADQGERNDVVVGTSSLLGQAVYTFTDNDATPITIGVGLCDLVNGVGMCSQTGIIGIVVDVRDRDDTAQVATAGLNGVAPPTVPTSLIGGQGIDVLMGGSGADLLKGNNGRDSLRGRLGTDIYKGGRGSDTLQTLDGLRDTVISCGEGGRDLLRADRIDPKPKSCELGGRNPSKPF
jgi:Ca2+-binding RTX toxin-like protein